jgi:hypothetical protein
MAASNNANVDGRPVPLLETCGDMASEHRDSMAFATPARMGLSSARHLTSMMPEVLLRGWDGSRLPGVCFEA